MQKTNFKFEVLIHDDASTDETEEIIRDFERRYPSIIKPIYEETNQWVKGRKGSAVFNFPRAKGKYIALCEGDDYWTDPLKLQKQVDFLEANENYNICFHKVNLLIKDALQENKGVTYKRYSEIENFPIDINTLLEKGNFIHTPSVVFRNTGLNELPFEFSKSPIGDYLLYIHLLKNGGFIKRLNDVMAVYRVGSGIYSSLNGLSYEKNMLIYQSCILSFLKDEEQRKIILKKQLNLLNKHFNKINKSENYYKMAKKISFKQYVYLGLNKVKVFLKYK